MLVGIFFTFFLGLDHLVDDIDIDILIEGLAACCLLIIFLN